MTDVFSIPQGNGFYNPPWSLDAAAPEYLAFNKSPKSTESPDVAIVTYCIIFNPEGVAPPKHKARVLLDVPVENLTAVVKSPKLTVLPLVAIVNNSMSVILSDDGEFLPPINKPLVDESPEDALPLFLCAASPKSCAFPVDAIVTKSITLVVVGADPAYITILLP